MNVRPSQVNLAVPWARADRPVVERYHAGGATPAPDSAALLERTASIMPRLHLPIAALVVALSTGSLPAVAQDAPKPHVPLEKGIGQTTPTGPVPSLAVMNAAGATLADGKLTLTGVAANTIVFADRPVRAAGHVTTSQFLMQWDGD
jgi:hypothetical protein